VFQLQVEAGTAFRHELLTSGLQFVDNSKCLILDRYILKEDNEIVDIEKALKTEIKQKHKVNFLISSALFQPENEQYILLCSYNYSNTIIACFNKSFEYISEVSITGKPIAIFPPRNWVIVQSGKHIFYNFQGEKAFELDYGNGNYNIEISNRGEYALSFGYATKSDLYELNTLKSKVLWAHPTFVKNYKELLYNDTHHNFDLSIAAFAPDDSYIVGGGHHGKYVAWKLPKMERFELIPAASYLPLFEGAEVVELEGAKFLKNRGNFMNNIKFFNGPGNFITRLGDKNLIWDKNFNNTGMLPIKGRIGSISEDYLTFIEDDVFHVYERI
jgi:WD40 repeat protein